MTDDYFYCHVMERFNVLRHNQILLNFSVAFRVEYDAYYIDNWMKDIKPGIELSKNFVQTAVLCTTAI